MVAYFLVVIPVSVRYVGYFKAKVQERDSAFWSWKPVGISSEYLFDTVDEWEINSYWFASEISLHDSDVLEVSFFRRYIAYRFYFFSCTSQPSGTTAVADPKLFVILLPGNWHLTVLSLSVLFFFSEVMYYLKPGIRKGNCENQNTIGIGFCYRNCIFIKCGECTMSMYVQNVVCWK